MRQFNQIRQYHGIFDLQKVETGGDVLLRRNRGQQGRFGTLQRFRQALENDIIITTTTLM